MVKDRRSNQRLVKKKCRSRCVDHVYWLVASQYWTHYSLFINWSSRHAQRIVLYSSPVYNSASFNFIITCNYFIIYQFKMLNLNCVIETTSECLELSHGSIDPLVVLIICDSLRDAL